METGYLNKYFSGISVKRLSAVETDLSHSNQHEYNANKGMAKLFGTEVSKREFNTTFIYLTDNTSVTANGKLTWYDARHNHPTRTEWRLYFQTTEVSDMARCGDTLFICKKTDDTIMVIITQQNSTIESQLHWLFGVDTDITHSFISKTGFNPTNAKLDWAVKTILEHIGIEYDTSNIYSYLEPMLLKFNKTFPSTKEFSAYARSTLRDVSPVEEPDTTLIKWVSREEALFRLLEKEFLKSQINQLIQSKDVDIDKFMELSLSIQNRRKSRAGLSLENHIIEILKANHICFSHTPITENKSKPDFIFPSIDAYRNYNFPAEYLSMLGAKTTCKDRWRQVLSEADRINNKHLLTLESAISKYQTDEMINKSLQLVIPYPLHETYDISQQNYIWTIKQFLDFIIEKQKFYQ